MCIPNTYPFGSPENSLAQASRKRAVPVPKRLAARVRPLAEGPSSGGEGVCNPRVAGSRFRKFPFILVGPSQPQVPPFYGFDFKLMALITQPEFEHACRLAEAQLLADRHSKTKLTKDNMRSSETSGGNKKTLAKGKLVNDNTKSSKEGGREREEL